MELSPKQQINELIKTAQKILITGHSDLNGDAVGAMIALDLVLSKMGKETTIVASERIEESLYFLPGTANRVQKDISGTRDFVVKLDTEKTPIEKISYEKEDHSLNIHITPRSGQISEKEIIFSQGSFQFDLIFVLDTPDVEKIDPVYDRYTELFFETPIVNIDHHAGNEYFGTVNLVDLTATSTCEILVSIIESFGAGNFDEDVATCLLTGIISDTASFKNTNTTPKSLTISAQMLAAGARQQEIIQNLYKTKPLSTLKLWGQVLFRIEFEKEQRLAWSAIKYKDLELAGAGIDEVHQVMDELFLSIPDTSSVLILVETEPEKITGLIKSLDGRDVLAIAQEFGGSGTSKSASFDMNMPLSEAINRVMMAVHGQKVKKDTVVTMEEIETTEDPISQAIKSIDTEIEKGLEKEIAPTIDVEEAKTKEEPMKALGEILEDYTPGNEADLPVEEPDDIDEVDEEFIDSNSKHQITNNKEE